MDQNDQKTKSQQFFYETIWIISWGLKIAGIIFICIVSYRIATATFPVDIFENYDFNDLLSLVLALFAIFISILFYFKSTESSNKFYSDTYNFTKNISEVIGRIDERFGERLRHLDESYEKIEKRVFNAYIKEDQKEKIQEQKEDADKKLKEANIKYEQQIDELLKRLKIGESDKHSLRTELSKYKSMTEEAAIEVDQLRRKIKEMDLDTSAFLRRNRNVITALKLWAPVLFEKANNSLFYEKCWEQCREQLPPGLINDMKSIGFIDEKGELTSQFYKYMLRLRNRQRP